MTDRSPWRHRELFLDTSAFFAVASRRDANHGMANALMRALATQRRTLITTNFVVAELHALLLSRIDRQIAARTLAEIDSSQRTTIIRVSADDELRAREIVFGDADKDFSLTDATSFAVMERFGIVEAFAFDDHFAQFGWNVMPPTERR